MGQVGGGAEKKGEMGRTTKKIGTQEKVGMEEGGTGRRWGQEEGSQKWWEQRSRNGRRQWGQEGDISRTTKKVEAEEEVGMEGGQIGCGTRQKGGHLKHREEWPEEPGEVSSM